MKLIILDRDGVINYESRDYIKSPDEWFPLPGSLEAIAELTKAGYTIVVATNQSGIARGYFSQETLDAIHEKLNKAVTKFGGKINEIYYCPHLPRDNCNCRKPLTGMFEQIAKDFNIDLPSIQAIFVGDSLRDVELGLRTGCNFFLVTGPGSDGEETLQQITAEQRAKITIVDDLADATSRLLYA
jgi:D-glycero-D-manno-heptose 1,7-bisphosphate phosphatase